jgi:glycosyltransferase involved in cell wall biosynthesis
VALRSQRTPLVSVLMPVRDGAAHLGAASESLERQLFDDYEAIVVDDGSRDRTPELLAAWARRDGRVRVLTGPRRGIARALDRALAEARAPLVARMDADDIALPRRLGAQVAALETEPGLDVLGTHVRVVAGCGELTAGMRRYEAWLTSLVAPADIARDLFVESPLCHPTVMARRERLLAAGGYRDVDGPEDYDLWLRLARGGAVMANLPEVLLEWRDRPDRATRTDPRYRAEAILRLKLRHLLGWRLCFSSSARRVGIWGAGPFGKRWSRRLRARGVEVAFFVEVAPRKIGQAIHGAPVISAAALPPPGTVPVLVAVGVEGARALIRGELARLGYREPDDALCLQ